MKILAIVAAVCVAFTIAPHDAETASSGLRSAVQGQAPRGRALTIEDYYRIKTVGDPLISPDGRWVAFTVSTRIEEDNTSAIDTYVVPADGSAAPRRITHEGRSVAAPRWADDGQLQYSLNARVNSAVFVGGDAPRARPEAGTSYKVAIDAPNATPVTVQAAPGGVLSLDGKMRALARDLPRAPVAAPAGTDFEKRHASRFKGRTFDWMRFQQDGQDYPTPDPRLRPAAEITVTSADPSTSLGASGSERTLTSLGMRPSNLTWHPNGSVIAFTADENWKKEQVYESPDIYTVSTTGDVKRLTNDGYVWSALSYSPDGQYLLAERTFGTGMIIDQKLSHGGSDDLLLWPVSGGAAINLTEKWDLEPNGPRWSADGRHVYFTAQKGGTVHVFRVAARAGAAVEQVTTGERRLGAVTFDRGVTRIAYTVGTYDSPSDVWSARIDGSDEKRLTDVHADIRAEIGITRTERINWKSADGTAIEGFLTYPHGYQKGGALYPLVVFNHGGPHSAVGYGFNFKQQYFAANGYFVLDTNFRSSTGYGDAFKWATWGAWGTKDGQDVIAGVDYVIANHPVDRARVATMGHSYGGFMTNWLITQYPDRFAAAASGAGISNWLSDYGIADIYRTKETEFFGTPWQEEGIRRMVAQSPLMQAGRVRTPTLFVIGEMDQRVPYPESEQMYFALRRQGVPAKMIAYAGQPHGISGHWNNVHRMLNELQWIDQYVKGRPPQTSASQRD
jgi:dipeptidyl aminopeptidase/acylaminoacyl peptidase